MNILRQYVRRVITEAAKDVGDIPIGVYVTVEMLSDGFIIYFSDPFNKMLDYPVRGIIEAYDPDDSTGPCDGAFVVRRAFADDGFGPLLYDIALEVAGERGLTMDRDTLSADAFGVWKYYLQNRSDVKKEKLSDCVIDPRIRKFTNEFPEGESPLHFRYIKNDGKKLRSLRSKGMLV